MDESKNFDDILNSVTSETNLIGIIFEVKEKESEFTRKELYDAIKSEINVLELYNTGATVNTNVLSTKIKATGDLIHELGDFTNYDNLGEHDDLGLTNDEVIAVAVELLSLAVLSTYDEINDATMDKRVKTIREYVTGFIGDADKTAAFIETTLSRNNGGAANG